MKRKIIPRSFLTGVLIFLLTCVASFAQDTLLVRYYDYKDMPANRYYADLLHMALRETESQDGPFKLLPVYQNRTQRETLKRLRVGDGVDVIFTMSSMARRWVFKAVNVPLTKGYIGVRLILVTPENRYHFAKITNANELRQKKLGQGFDWPDTQILEDNGMNVVTSLSVDSLVDMLMENKIDGFPRGVTEFEGIISKYPHRKMVAANDIYIKYPTDMYFYVRKDNISLAERLEKGLKAGQKDGSFNKIFRKYLQPSIDAAHLDERHVIKLSNPTYTRMLKDEQSR